MRKNLCLAVNAATVQYNESHELKPMQIVFHVEKETITEQTNSPRKHLTKSWSPSCRKSKILCARLPRRSIMGFSWRFTILTRRVRCARFASTILGFEFFRHLFWRFFTYGFSHLFNNFLSHFFEYFPSYLFEHFLSHLF